MSEPSRCYGDIRREAMEAAGKIGATKANSQPFHIGEGPRFQRLGRRGGMQPGAEIGTSEGGLTEKWADRRAQRAPQRAASIARAKMALEDARRAAGLPAEPTAPPIVTTRLTAGPTRLRGVKFPGRKRTAYMKRYYQERKRRAAT